MEIDSKLLASYRNLLSATKDTLAFTQYTQLLNRVDIPPTKRLENSYKSLFKAIDKYSQGDMDKLLGHRFLFEILKASPKKSEIYEELRTISVISLNPQVLQTQWATV